MAGIPVAILAVSSSSADDVGKYKGNWANETSYAYGDEVSSQGDLFQSIVAHTSEADTQPGVGVSWSTKWARMVSATALPNSPEGGLLVIIDGVVVATISADLLANSLQAVGEVDSGSVASGAATITEDANTAQLTATGLTFNATELTADVINNTLPLIEVGPSLLSLAANVRLDLTTATKGDSVSLAGTGKGQPVISCWNATTAALELVSMATPSTLLNTALDLDGTALAGGTTPYALYLEPDGTIVAKKWTDATTRAVELADWHGFMVYDNTTDAGKQRRHIGDILPRIHWNPAAAWSNATTYYNGELATEGGHTFISLASANLNHATSDTDWWQDCGESPGDGRGSFADEVQFRLVLSAYNQEPKEFGVTCPYAANTTESLNTSTQQVVMKDANNNTKWKAECLCSGRKPLSITLGGIRAGNGHGYLTIALDSMTTAHPNSFPGITETVFDTTGSRLDVTPSEGYHYVVPLVETYLASVIDYWNYGSDLQAAKAQFLGTWRG